MLGGEVPLTSTPATRTAARDVAASASRAPGSGQVTITNNANTASRSVQSLLQASCHFHVRSRRQAGLRPTQAHTITLSPVPVGVSQRPTASPGTPVPAVLTHTSVPSGEPAGRHQQPPAPSRRCGGRQDPPAHGDAQHTQVILQLCIVPGVGSLGDPHTHEGDERAWDSAQPGGLKHMMAHFQGSRPPRSQSTTSESLVSTAPIPPPHPTTAWNPHRRVHTSTCHTIPLHRCSH